MKIQLKKYKKCHIMNMMKGDHFIDSKYGALMMKTKWINSFVCIDPNPFSKKKQIEISKGDDFGTEEGYDGMEVVTPVTFPVIEFEIVE